MAKVIGRVRNVMELINKIQAKFKANFPTEWDAWDVISEAYKSEKKWWKQVEWQGFYFKELVKKLSAPIIYQNSPRYGLCVFDGSNKYPVRIKLSTVNLTKDILLNDTNAVLNALNDYDMLLVILGVGEGEKENGKLTNFVDYELGEGASEYKKRGNVRGYKRNRKELFVLQKIYFIVLNKENLEKTNLNWQKGFVNSNGTARNEKILFRLEELDKEIKFVLDYQ